MSFNLLLGLLGFLFVPDTRPLPSERGHLQNVADLVSPFLKSLDASIEKSRQHQLFITRGPKHSFLWFHLWPKTGRSRSWKIWRFNKPPISCALMRFKWVIRNAQKQHNLTTSPKLTKYIHQNTGSVCCPTESPHLHQKYRTFYKTAKHSAPWTAPWPSPSPFFWLAYCITSFFTWHQKNVKCHLLGCTQTGLQGYPTISSFGLVHPITPDLCAAKRWASAFGTNEQPPGHRKDQRCFFSNATGHVILALISWWTTARPGSVAAHNKAGVPVFWLIEHWGVFSQNPR